MDIDSIRKALAGLPEVAPDTGGEGLQQDILSVAEEFTKTLRKVGIQQTRSNTDAIGAIQEAGARITEIHDAAIRERDRAVAAERRVETFAQVLIEHLDFFDRAISLLEQAGGLDAWAEQFVKGRDRLVADAKKVGLQEVGEVGERFDAALHDSTNEIPRSSGNPIVEAVTQRGYVLDARVLRRAEVQIRPDEEENPQ